MELSVRLPNISPEISANVFSKLFFCWVLHFMKYASNHVLQIRDVYDTVESDSAAHLTEELERHWNQELKVARIKNGSPNFVKVLFQTFGKSFLLYGTCLLFQVIIIRLLLPILLVEYIQHFEERTDQIIGWYLSAGITILAVINNLVYHHTFVGCSLIGMRAKTAVSSLIQKKILRLSSDSLYKTSPSELVQLLSKDVKKIEAAIPYLHYLYLTPIQFIVSTYILINIIGVAALPGIIFMVLVCFPEGYLSSLQRGIRNQVSAFTSERVTKTKEILNGVRIIKMNGWEKPFENIVEKVREYELNLISKQIYIRCFSLSAIMFTQSVGVFLAITTYILLGNQLRTDLIFAVVLIFYYLQQYACYFFPESIERYADAKESILKIVDFLIVEEKEERVRIISCTKAARKPGTINITQASANLENQQVLHEINLKMTNGKFYCIFGHSGSGKTSFIQLLLKELTLTSGRVDIAGTVSYASQKPWLFPSTVKSNILCGQPYNRHKYREIVRICALDTEFQKLPYGDRVPITDKRIAENDGIKEKINLARTIYKDADIYIVDDCFGFIDPQMEKVIFTECFNKYLKNKTRIFVSNKLCYAKETDTIVVFEKGTITKTLDKEEITEEDLQFLDSKISIENNMKFSDLKLPVEETNLSDYDCEQEVVPKIESRRGYFITLMDFLNMCQNQYLVDGVIVLIMLTQIAANISDIWLLQWINYSPSTVSDVKLHENRSTEIEMKESLIEITFYRIIYDIIYGIEANIYEENKRFDKKPTLNTNLFGLNEEDVYICFYAGFIIVCIILTCATTLLYHTACMKASRALHSKIVEKVLHSPMKFFENYSPGRILQRFSKGMEVIDGLPHKNFITLQMFAAAFGTTLLVLYASPAMILPMLLVVIMLHFLILCYVSALRGLQRLANNSEASISFFLKISYHGVYTIRSAEAEPVISEVFENLLDEHTSIWNLILRCNEYFSFYLDMLNILFMMITTVFMVIVKHGETNTGYIGLAVTYSIILTELLHVGLRENIEVLAKSSVIESTMQYTKLLTEDLNISAIIPKKWPYCGKIIFKNVYVKENDGCVSMLKNLNISITPGEKIAVVSRYPDEKWTIVNCLLRLIHVDGLILVDEIDTTQISLGKLRSAITVITRKPVLFAASVRFNLDPLDHASDEMLWKVIEETGLKTCIQSLSQPVVEGGVNFNFGQRKLLCLARAMLRNSKILIIENDTVEDDSNAEDFIQKIIREKFKKCTIITVANNLSSIMDNDKILVIDEGREVEYANAHELLKNPEGYLTKLVKEAGPKVEKHVKKIARDSFDLKNLDITFKFE